MPVPAAAEAARTLAVARGAAGLLALGWGERPPSASDAPRRTLLHLHDVLERARLPHAFFKGPFADGALWGGHGYRLGEDVDVLVRPDDELAALAALAAAGFTQAKSHGLDATAAVSKARRLLPLDPALRSVDLHLRPLNDPPFPARADDVLATARSWQLGDVTVPGPDPAVLLVWSAGNLAGGRLQGLVRQAADAARALCLQQVDWDLVVATARAWRASAAAWGFLRLLERRLGAAVQSATLEQLAPPGPVGRVVERIFGVVGAPLEPDHVLLGILGVEWALSGRALWPAERILRSGALRLVDRVLDALRGSPAAAADGSVTSTNAGSSAVSIAIESKVSVPPDVLLQEIDGEAVLLDLRTETYFGLDEVGTLLFRALKEQGTLASAVEAGLAAFDVEREELSRDLLELVEHLAAEGLVVVEP
ncbi:MAG: PqqD family protein [Deltaproteobacteria bacterium]|nr:PqqD family protein [Deltaproteobacteria bacterium]